MECREKELRLLFSFLDRPLSSRDIHLQPAFLRHVLRPSSASHQRGTHRGLRWPPGQEPSFRPERRNAMPLTDIAVRQARPKDKIYTLTDGRGLGLCVKPGGGKSWHFRYYWSGKQKRIALGKYPEISLKEARGRCEAARALVAQGINPLKRRQQEVLVKRLAADRLFQSVFDQWLAHRSLVLHRGAKARSSRSSGSSARTSCLPLPNGRSTRSRRPTCCRCCPGSRNARHSPPPKNAAHGSVY